MGNPRYPSECCALSLTPAASVVQDYYYSDWTEEERAQGKHMQVRCHTPVLHHTVQCRRHAHNALTATQTHSSVPAEDVLQTKLSVCMLVLQVMKFCNESKSQRGMKRIQMEAKTASVENGAV